jgi:hypothetical protein
MKLTGIMLCIVILPLASFPCAAAGAPHQVSPAGNAGALFEENVLTNNAAAVRARSAGPSDQTRFDLLLSWVLPSESHSTIRMTGDFTQTKQNTVVEVGSFPPSSICWIWRSGRIVSPKSLGS